ncbi:hypothetical protein KHF85_02130 [Xanthomonas translucens pv. graminis]|uniref:hypothetical protein n=1 Tax=Xanthomonas graminis TaxID=3390026 RepID=UPI00253F6794|nr:hypothetical protein [Xanthomonas translucens]WIH05341.1 hypothetical protein KHF85_02130 [Xanthomonas translucens pv. graminis]
MNRRGAALASLALAALALHAHAAPTTPAATAPCVQVRIGEDVAGHLDCLNQTLRAAAASARPGASPLAAAATTLDPLQRGQPTPAALRQRYGDAYGRSLVPQRPQPRYLPTPFAPAR